MINSCNIYLPEIETFGIFYILFQSIYVNLSDKYNCFYKKNMNDVILKDGDFIFVVPQFHFRMLNAHANKNINIIIVNTEPMFFPHFPIPDYINNIANFTTNHIFILDYQPKNIHYFIQNNKNDNMTIKYFPFTYNNYISNLISHNKCEKNIDIYFYGHAGPRRRNMLQQLSEKGYNVVLSNKTSSYYGDDVYKEQYETINKSKIIINIFQHDINKCFDYYRFSILLSNKVFFITEEFDIDENIENILIDYKKYIIQFNEKNIFEVVEKCLQYSEEEKSVITNNAYEWYKNISNYDENWINFLNQTF